VHSNEVNLSHRETQVCEPGATMFSQEAIRVAESSQIGEVRRRANRLAVNAGLNPEHCGRVAIVAAELATNLVKYAPGGDVLLRTYQWSIAGCCESGVELISVDRGSGIANVAQALEDGFSHGSTPGNGLGAVRRLATEFDIYSTVPGGTIVFARIGLPSRRAAGARFQWGAVNRPAPREQLCGDTWRISERDGELALMVADGLGHGPAAAEAADAAAAAFEENGFAPLVDLFELADRRLRRTRGAAIAVAQITSQPRLLKYVGVGNIAGSLRSRRSTTGRGLVSHNGTVGAEMRKVQQFELDCPEDAVLVMHSDGLQSRWSLDAYPRLIHCHPAVIASVLWRDFTRGRDDVTVCVVRCLPSPN